MRFAKTTVLCAAIAGLAGSVVFAGGHANVEGAIKARKGQMQMYAYNLGILGNMAKGAVDFDAAAAQRAADTLVALSSIDSTDLWPVGSSADDVDGSRALAKMWDEIPEVLAIAMKTQEAAAGLAANAGSLDGIRANIGAMGESCGACHKPYRQPK